VLSFPEFWRHLSWRPLVVCSLYLGCLSVVVFLIILLWAHSQKDVEFRSKYVVCTMGRVMPIKSIVESPLRFFSAKVCKLEIPNFSQFEIRNSVSKVMPWHSILVRVPVRLQPVLGPGRGHRRVGGRSRGGRSRATVGGLVNVIQVAAGLLGGRS